MKDKKKNIAVFVKNLTSGGAEKQAVLLAKALQDDYDMHFVIFNGDKMHQKYLDMLENAERIKIKAFRGGHIRRFVEFIKYLKENHISTVFSYLTAANLYACLASAFHRMKVVTGLRNARLPLGKHLMDMTLTNVCSSLAIANCYSGKEHFGSRGFIPSRIEVIPNCIENISGHRDKFTPPPYPVRIITVGRFVAQKDYETAIKVIAEVKEKGGNIHFDIVGFGELEMSIRQWVKEYHIGDITTFHINPDHIAKLLEQADIYLSTSLFEGTSNSIMEAMNADLPIICTDVGDNKYLVSDGINGWLARIGDVDKMASDILSLLNDAGMRKRMGNCSKEHLKTNYSVEVFRKRYIDIVERVSR